MLECEDEILSTTDTISITNKNNLFYLHYYFINNHALSITSYCFYRLLLLLHQILFTKRILLIEETIEENYGNKYLTLVSTDKNKGTLKTFTELWEDKIKDLIRPITNTLGDYDEKYMKIKFNSNDNLPLNKILKLYDLPIVFRFVFQKDEKHYPQVFLD